MINENLNILILEDLPSDAELAKRELKKSFDKSVFLVVDNEKDFVTALTNFKPDLIISDYQLPTFTGMAALKIKMELFPCVPLVIFTGSINEDTAVECMKAGADDYVLKEHIKRLGAAALNALNKKNIESDKLKMTEALKVSEEKYRTLFNSIRDAIVVTDIDKNIVGCNQSFSSLFEYTADEIKGRHSLSLQIDIEVKPNLEKKVNIPHEGKLFYSTVNYKKKSGTIFPGETSIYNIKNDQGEITGFIGLIRDITERIEAENKIKSALKKAEESDHLKSAFLANMSHEIRTPMNGILGFNSLLKNPNLSGSKQQEYIKIIEKSGIRMLNTVNDIIDISKIEAGQMGISLSETNIHEMFENLKMFFGPEIIKKGLELQCKTPLSFQNTNITTDREKIYAILSNIIKNAIKFTDKGEIEIAYSLKPNELNFYVKDTGIGIPENRLEAIFDRFIQADIDDKSGYQGSGLGLSISKSYVDMLGGNIRVESKLGIGSQFYVTIPLENKLSLNFEAPKLEHVVPDENKGIKNLSILIAEDESDSYFYMSILLKRYSKTILHAFTGIEAVNYCKNNQDIDLILMDIKMPKMNGYEASKLIREFNKDVIIIAQTAYALPDDRKKAIAVGCNDYISKPIREEELLTLLKKYFT